MTAPRWAINATPHRSIVDETADAGHKQRMFGLGIHEIILTTIIMAVVWYGFKIITWDNPPKKRDGGKNGDANSNPGAVVLQACRVCGVYVALGSSDCGSAECPYPEG